MVEAERLAPVRQAEIGIDGLRFAKCLAGILELEAVKRLHAGEERGLSPGGAGVGKVDAAQVRRQAAGGFAGGPGERGKAEQPEPSPEADDAQEAPRAPDDDGRHGVTP
ncbi:MAG: hypothetical protein OXQ28_11590 [Acidobacteriota bacterium]|nr:hypothetical protein [Acidobacteriota bacterium]